MGRAVILYTVRSQEFAVVRRPRGRVLDSRYPRWYATVAARSTLRLVSPEMRWLPGHQDHVLYSLAHADATIDRMSRVLETYLQDPGPLDLRSRLTSTTEEVVLVGVAPLPQAVPRLFADALNQLRNVLEHSLNAELEQQLGRGLTLEEGRAVEVPATGDEDAFNAWSRHKHRRSHGLMARGSEIGERLARLQPWNRQESDMHPLRRLVAHTNAAKHHAPSVTTVRVGRVMIDSASRQLPSDVHDLGGIGAVLASVPRGTREQVSVWPEVAVRRPHTGELRTLMWEVREIEEWVRRIAIPILIFGRSDLHALPPHLDINRGYLSADHAWSSARHMAAALRASERLQAAALRVDLVEMMVVEDGEGARETYSQWLESIEDAGVVAMFEPLGSAARVGDLKGIATITAHWRAQSTDYATRKS